MKFREDILTPKERLGAFLSGQELDRMLCMPIVTSNAALMINKSVKEFQLDPEVMANSYIAAYERFGYDLNYLFTNCSYIAEAMGQELVYSENEPANTEVHIIQSEDDLSKIKVAKRHDGNFSVFYDALDILNEKTGGKIFNSVCFSGPVSTAATLRGTESFARDSYSNPDLCHKLLRMSTDSIKNFIEAVVEKGAIPIILEPIASGSIFSPKMYDKFAAPYINELIDYAHELGAAIPLHICGKTNKIIGRMADSGTEIVSFDLCDLDIAKEQAQGKAVLLGNVSPSDELLFGPDERIINACKETIDKMSDYKPGFILATGCEISTKVPLENVDVMMKAVRTHGLYDYEK